MLNQRTLPAPPPPSPLLIRSPCPAVPFPAPAICIYSEEAAAASEKKTRISFIYSKVSPQPALTPYLLHFSFYICTYIFVVSKKKRFFFVKLTQQLANWTHYSGQLERQRKN